MENLKELWFSEEYQVFTHYQPGPDEHPAHDRFEKMLSFCSESEYAVLQAMLRTGVKKHYTYDYVKETLWRCDDILKILAYDFGLNVK